MVTRFNIFKNYVFIIFGIFIVGYIITIRLIITRLPRELPKIDSMEERMLYSLIPLCFITIVIIGILQYYKKLTNIAKTKFPLNIFNTIFKIYTKSLLGLDAIIKRKIPSKILGENLMRFTMFYTLYLTLTQKRIYTIIYLFFSFAPKFLFLFLFLYDVFYLKKFTYIYYYGWILIIPLIFNYLLFTLKEFSRHNLNRYLEVILLVIDNDDVLIENVNTILESCKKYAIQHYYNDANTVEFEPALYAQISDHYLTTNCITTDSEIDRVSFLRKKEFAVHRIVYTQMIIFDFICDKYAMLLNNLYYLSLGIIWIYIIS